jgi:ABC-type sugar transport system ATPase subunit
MNMNAQKQIEITALIDSIRTMQAELWSQIDKEGQVSADIRSRLNALMITFVGESNLNVIEQAIKREVA